MELFPYQKQGAAFLAERRRALLADEMGLGKSAQAIRAADSIGAATVLVLCPAVARVNWSREWWKFSPFDRPVSVLLNGRDPVEPAGVTVVSYDLLARAPVRERVAALRPDVLIVDEAHYLKGRRTKRTKAVFGKGGLAASAGRLWLLTGTPMPNHPGELWPMLHALGAVEVDYWRFVRRYCTGHDNGFGFQITGGKNLRHLRSLIDPIMLRRKKDDVMKELPPISWHDVVVEPSAVNWDEYSGLIHYLSRKPGTFEKDIEAQMQMVEHVVRHSHSDDRVSALQALGGSVTTLRQYTGLAKLPRVAEMVAEDLDRRKGEKLVIFAVHRDVIEGLRQELRRFGAVTLYGGTDPSARAKRVDRFQKDPKCRVFIGNVQAAGTAITLTAARDVLFAEASWVPAENAQAAMRVHRIGQERNVRVTFVGLAGSVDERVQQVLRRKSQTIAKVFD